MTQRLANYPTGLGVTYGDFVRNLFRPLAPAAMLAHAAMGVVTELREVEAATSFENALEEAGDIAFFCQAFVQCLPHNFDDDAVAAATADAVLAYLQYAGIEVDDLGDAHARNMCLLGSIDMLDAAKRWLAYDKAPNRDACLRLAGLAEMIGSTFLEMSPSPDAASDSQNIIDVNVAKLRSRYKEGFSTDAAVNRDTATEAEVIRGAAWGL